MNSLTIVIIVIIIIMITTIIIIIIIIIITIIIKIDITVTITTTITIIIIGHAPPQAPLTFNPKFLRVGWTSLLLMCVSTPLDPWAHVWGSCVQWFGDLVTCDYWGELWLNEGFATYFENYGATAARPEYRFFDTFYATQASLGQIVDAKNVSTHPLATITGVHNK